MSAPVDPNLIRQIMAQVNAEPLTKRLPCGCELGEVGDAFVMRPCSLRCRYYLGAMEAASMMGKPVGYAYEGGQN